MKRKQPQQTRMFMLLSNNGDDQDSASPNNNGVNLNYSAMLQHTDACTSSSTNRNTTDFLYDAVVKATAAKEPKRKPLSPAAVGTAPELNKWTDIMAQETRHVFDRQSSTSCSNQNIMEAEELYHVLQTTLTDDDYANIELYWNTLLPKIYYFIDKDDANRRVKEALKVAYFAHRNQKRKSGEPFIIHPVQVALLLAELKMDVETVISGLLHDTVEDTELTFGQVETLFGKTVRGIVEGETKVSKLPKLAFSDYADEQAENLRQMFVAMTDDYRIIIVKLADRLHNMRTLKHMSAEKQTKISRETLDIFAPLAHRMGIWQFKSELEDTSFMYLYPQEYDRLNTRLRRHQAQFRDTLEKSQLILSQMLENDPTLKEQNVQVKVYGRTKELYSLWHKMETKDLKDLEQIHDVVALRVVLCPQEEESDKNKPQLLLGATNTANTDNNNNNESSNKGRGVWLCYHVLGLVQHLPGFQPVPTRVKDYISFPKPNGYQSLHTALMLNGQTVEVQIRTSAMHQVAEYGMASHWAYTGEKRGMDRSELFNTPWLSSIKEWQHDVLCSRDFVESVRQELLGKRVFVFLRNGKILNLPRGATVVDAAFQIHSEVGLNMHGAQINGRPAPFSYELRNGDVVSILTGEGKPTTDWMRFAKSRSTRARLRAYFRIKQRESLQEAGAILLSDFLKVHQELIAELSFLDTAPPTTLKEFAELLPKNSRYDDLDDLLTEIGKRHDRRFLRSTVAKYVRVPLWALDESERRSGYKGRVTTEKVFAAVLKSRRVAQDAGSAAAENEPSVTDETPTQQQHAPADGASASSLLSIGNNTASSSLRQTANGSSAPSPARRDDINLYILDGETQFADPEHMCEDCLPVKGDDIVGTKAVGIDNAPSSEAPVIVHRRACIHAQRALNRKLIVPKPFNTTTSESLTRNGERRFNNSYNGVSSTGERIFGDSLEKERFNRATLSAKESVPVKLKWVDGLLNSNGEDDVSTYMAEIVVVANDRKMLLADCSEIVSDIAFIVKTGSVTTDEHATLEFLVKVSNLPHLQRLMDSLRVVKSVMSVERKFGSDLFC